jgi:hypothetical protein
MAGAFAQMPAPDRKAAEAAEAAKRQAAEEETAEGGASELAAAELEMSRRLIQASNTATAVLEADAAFSKAAHGWLPAYDLPFFQEQAQIEREQYLERMLTAAGRGLLDAFTELFNADALWVRLARSERELRQVGGADLDAFRARMALAELLTHHIPEMLVSLGYRPPPPAEDWTDIVQNSMQIVLAADPDDGAVARNTDRARHELALFNWRLRKVVEDAEQAQAAAGPQLATRSRLPLLRAAVSAARNKAVPAALAAGASAAVGGAAGGPAGMGIALLSGSVASLVGTVTAAAATALLAERASQDVAMSAVQLIRTDLEALDDCVELIRSATQTTTEAIGFIIRRGVFQTLQDAAECPAPVRDFLYWEWSRTLLSRLDACELSADDAHELISSAMQTISERR